MGQLLDEVEQEHRRKNMIKYMLEEIAEDTMQVFDFGASKHPDSGDIPNFLMPNGNKCDRVSRGSSCLRHAAEVYGDSRADWESGIHPALHLIASAAIMYIRHKRNIIHPLDEK